MNEWISVDDKLPEIDIDVLCYTKHHQLIITYMSDIGMSYPRFMPVMDGDTFDDVGVIFWMHLPQLPNKIDNPAAYWEIEESIKSLIKAKLSREHEVREKAKIESLKKHYEEMERMRTDDE